MSDWMSLGERLLVRLKDAVRGEMDADWGMPESVRCAGVVSTLSAPR